MSVILQRVEESKEKNAILLFREGIFWRAYEHGALALCEYVHPFKVTARYFKAVGQWVCYVGFPDASFAKWTEGRAVSQVDENCLSLPLAPEEEAHVEAVFDEWKSQAVSLAKANDTAIDRKERNGIGHELTSIASRTSLAQHVVMRLQAFQLERSSPLDCMNFVAELKALLYDDEKSIDPEPLDIAR